MRNSYRVLVAEIVLTAFISTLIPSSLLFADDIDPILSDTTDIVNTEDSVVESTTANEDTLFLETSSGSNMQSDTEEIDTASGDILSGSLLSSTETDTATGSSTDSGTVSVVSTGSHIQETDTASGDVLSGSIATNPMIDTSTGNLTTTGTLSIDESDIDLSQKAIVQPIDEHPEREILVQFKSDIDGYIGQYQISQIENTHDLKATDTISEQNIAVMEVTTPSAMGTTSSANIADTFTQSGTTDPVLEKAIDTKIAELKADPRVEHVQRNFVYSISSMPPTKNLNKDMAILAWTGRNLPNESGSGFSQLWGLDNQGQSVNGTSGIPDADIDYPEAMNYASGKLGTGVIVAVLDTGIAYNHPDLREHMWNGQNCLSDTGAYIGGCLYGYDFGDDDKNPTDSKEGFFGHGTHVAGTIGAITNNGTGIVGVAPNLQIMSVKIFGTKSRATTSSIIRGINFAKYNGANVINASFGGGNYTPKTTREFDFFTYQAIQDFPGLFIAAAGNDGENTDNGRFYPAGFGSDLTVSGEIIISGKFTYSGTVSYPGLQNVIAVAASDESDNLTSFSNYGTGTVHIAAPGINIYSTYPVLLSDTDYMTGDWMKTGGSHSGIFLMSGSLISGGYLLMDDMRMSISGEPLYVSGETAYIEKTFTSSGMKSAYVGSIPIWCDTPSSSSWKDYVSIAYDSGSGYIEDKRVDEDSLWGTLWATETTIDGREGILGYVATDTFDAPNSTFKIRLGWHTDGIDDVDPATGKYYGGCRITNGFFVERTDNGESGGYNFLLGTSMAAPHVAGAAALAMSYRPTATLADVKNAIIWGGDFKNQLSEKVLSGNRLNLVGMLMALEHPTISLEGLTLSGESGVKIKVKTNPANIDAGQQITLSKDNRFYGTTWHLQDALTMVDNGLIPSESTEAGYQLNGNFTRAELARITAKIGGYTPTNCRGNVFDDVSANLGSDCGYIEGLAEAGVITTAYATFRPIQLATIGESYKMLLASMGELPSMNTGSVNGTGELERYAERVMELGCGIQFPLTNQMTRGSLYGTAVCLYDLPTAHLIQDRHIRQSQGDTFEFNNLTPDTIYYYKMQAHGGLFSSPESPVYSFRTPHLISYTGSGNVASSGAIYLSGSTSSGVTYGTGTQTLILTESGTSSRVTMTLPLRGLTITSSSAWDGIIQSPVMIASATGISLGTTNTGVQSIYMIGSESTSLALSGGLATISMQVSGATGSILPVYRSPNSSTPFVQIGTCIVTAGLCTFTTTHFSLFAVGAPISVVTQPPVVVSGGSSGGPGGPSPSSMSPSLSTLSTLLQNQYSPSPMSPVVERLKIDTSKKSSIFSILRGLQLKKAITDTMSPGILEALRTSIATKTTLGAQLMGYNNSITSIELYLQSYRPNSVEYTVLADIKKKINTERQIFLRDIFSKR